MRLKKLLLLSQFTALSVFLAVPFLLGFCISSDILSGILSGISSDSRLRSGGEHCQPTLAVEEAAEKEDEEEEEAEEQGS